MKRPYHCAVCGEDGHNRRLHEDIKTLSRSMEAGRLVYEEGLSFAEAARRIGISRQAAHQGWKHFVQRGGIGKEP